MGSKGKQLHFTLVLFALSNIILIFSYKKLSFFTNTNNRKFVCISSGLCLALPDADGVLMKPHLPPVKWPFYHGDHSKNNSDHRIFFHETSGLNQLTLRQCCAVESAAKHHPDRPVQLFLRSFNNLSTIFSSSHSLNSLHRPAWLEVLSQYANIDVILINEDRYFAGTPLEDWQRKGEVHNSRFEVVHLSDYIRILTLYKGGGLYLDLDILTIKPFIGDTFRNFLVYGNADMNELSNGAMHLERGHWMASEIIQLLAKEYEPNSYVYNGPDALFYIMNRVCGLDSGNPKSNRCADVQLLPDVYFYPIPSIFSYLLYNNKIGNRTDSETLKIFSRSFGLHLCNSLSSFHEPFSVNSNQIVSVMAHQHCPLTILSATDFESL